MLESLFNSKLSKETQEKLKQTLKDLVSKDKPANILIMGKTGVGKSSLINAVFDKKLAKTGVGRPVTQHIECHNTPDSPINIWDTKGLELEGFETIKKDIVDFVEKHNTSPNANEYIHLAWLCIPDSGARIEDAEIELAKSLKELEGFQKFKINVVIVITKCDSPKHPKSIEFYNFVKRTFRGCHVVQTRIKEDLYDDDGNPTGEARPAYGLNELCSISYQLIPEAQQRAFATALNIANKQAISAKKEEAEKVVKWAMGAAGLAAATPIPFSDALCITPIQAAMIAKISSIFGMSVIEGNIKASLVTLLAPLAAAAAGRSLFGGILKLIPGVGSLVGGMLSASVASLLTQQLGNLYIAVLIKFVENNKPLEMGAVFESFKKELESKEEPAS